MPIKRKKNKKGKKGDAARRVPKRTADLSLPDKPSEPETDLQAYTWLLYGEKKIGKTSLAARFPNAMFLMTEPGGKALRIHQRPVSSWTELVDYVELLEDRAAHNFETVVVDTVDIAYQLCFNYMCDKLAIEHPHDEQDFGKSWGKIENEFVHVFRRLLSLPNMGAVLISHAHYREITKPTGEKMDVITPTMSNQASRFCTGVIDIWGYYCYHDEDRVLRLGGSDHIGAGIRPEENFNHTDGTPIFEIPMGHGAEEAYAAVEAAFNNELPRPDSRPSRPRGKFKRKGKGKAKLKRKKRK